MSGDWWAGFLIGAFSGAVAVGIAWMTAVGIGREDPPSSALAPVDAAVVQPLGGRL